jgi:uncharacterized protein (DUF58 family)
MPLPWFTSKGHIVQVVCAVIATLCAVIALVLRIWPNVVVGASFTLYALISLLTLSVVVLVSVIRASMRPSLVVHRAIYHPASNPIPGKDVTMVVRRLIKEQGPSFLVDTNTFGDPFINLFKALTIDYSFRGERRTKTIAQDQWFNLP